MRLITFILFLQLAVGSWQISIAQNSRANKSEEAQLWKSLKKETGFKKIFKKYKKYRFEIIFTQIDRGLNGEIKLKNFHLGDSLTYFYPASTVKFPLAIAVAEMLQNAPFHNVNRNMFLKLDTVSYCSHVYENSNYEYHRVKKGETWGEISRKYRITIVDFLRWNKLDANYIPEENTSVKIYHRKIRPSINDLISSMLVYSDNESYNKLFEMAGGEYLGSWMKDYGFVHSNITRKFLFCEGEEKSVSVSYDILNERDVIIHHSNEKKWEPANNFSVSGIKVGKKHYWKNELMNSPRDFSDHNRVLLSDLHEMMQRLIFPEIFSNEDKFKMDSKSYKFLIKKLGIYPSEHLQPLDSVYDLWEDGRNIFLFNGDDSTDINPKFRMVNITGQAYGFSNDCMYFTDNETKTEFFLSVRIYTNKNEILGDDKYEYEEIAMPLMKKIGEYFFEMEKKRKKEVLPEFTLFRNIFD